MNRELLYQAMTEIKDELVDEAAEAKAAKKKIRWLKFGSIAAAVVLAAGLGWGAIRGKIAPLPPGSAAGGSGHDEGSTFMSYAGPVFPLTAVSGGTGLTVSRELTYDFSPWTPVWRSNEEEADSIPNLTEEEREAARNDYDECYPEGGSYQTSTDLLVTDSYTLTNPTGADKTVRLL